MPFPYSIANGINFGFMTCTRLKLLTGLPRRCTGSSGAIAAIFL
jgi:xanthine/uracil/vitamin C permease (AzgA family)